MNSASTSSALDQWVQTYQGVQRDTPALIGVDGRLLLEVEGAPVTLLQIAGGHAQIAGHAEAESPDASIDFSDAQTLMDVLGGELNPVVAALQGRMSITGNRLLATKALLGLPADKPFATPQTGKEDNHAN
jgi:hypothetical protein